MKICVAAVRPRTQFATKKNKQVRKTIYFYCYQMGQFETCAGRCCCIHLIYLMFIY